MYTTIDSQGHLCNCLKLLSLFTSASFWSIDVCAYVHAMCACAHMCLCVCIHMPNCACAHTGVCVCVCACTCLHMHVHTQVCLCVCTCTCICLCVCVQLWKVPLSNMSRNKAEERNGARTVWRTQPTNVLIIKVYMPFPPMGCAWIKLATVCAVH